MFDVIRYSDLIDRAFVCPHHKENNMARPIVTLDVECYPNYFLARFEDLDGRVKNFSIWNDDTSQFDRARIRTLLKQYTIITFNGNGYDKWVLFGALEGYTNEQLHELTERIIVGRMKPWDIEREYDLVQPSYMDHIDLIEPAPAVMISLKMYGGRLHAPRMQDLPYEPGKRLTPTMRDNIRDYCGNDHDVTRRLYHAIKKALDLRASMSEEYGVDLRSKSDAQIGEALLRMAVEKRKGHKVYKPDIPPGHSFKYVAPKFISFKSKELREVLYTAQSVRFYLDKGGSPQIPKAIEDLNIVIAGKPYTMAIGGLHSCESSVSYTSDDEYQLRDIDVASYYPNIILNCKLFPKHLGPDFLVEYRRIVQRRLDAKPSGKNPNPTVDGGLKIAINGSYGKFGSKYSVLYAPDLMLQVTLTGQLCLLMLIEALENAGIEVVSANTDGIVTRFRRADEATLKAIVADWEFTTGFDMEGTDYRAIYLRDVNSYIAIKPDGQVKSKGTFARNITIGKDGKESISLQKTPQAEVCVEAVIQNLLDGTPVMKTIRACRDIRKFVSVRKVTCGAWFVQRDHVQATPAKKKKTLRDAGWDEYGGDMWGPKDKAIKYHINRAFDMVLNAGLADEYLGKTVRWAYAKEGRGYIRNAKGAKVANTDNCRPLMELPDELPDWIDYEWYAKEAMSMLVVLGAL